MKVLLIFLFISLVGYLIIHMCGGFKVRRKKTNRPLQDVDKRLIVLDNLASLNDNDLSRLKGEIQDLKEILERGRKPDLPRKGEEPVLENRGLNRNRSASPIGSKLSRKALLEKIQREAREGIAVEQEDSRRPSGLISRIIVINVLLILITLLVMLI